LLFNIFKSQHHFLLSKSNQTSKSVGSAKSKIKTGQKVDGGTKSSRSNVEKSNKVVEDAKKSLTPQTPVLEKPAKKKKSTADKGLSTYEEQALQGVTKSKGNKKLLIIFLSLGLVVVAGVAIALFFILKPEEDGKAVVCKVEVLSYYVDRADDPEEYIVIGSGDKFDFTQETQTTSSYTKDVDVTITDEVDFAMTYLVNNVTPNSYSYTLDFSGLQFSNCNIVVKINNGKSYSIDNGRKVITISQMGDVVLEVRISGVNPPVYDENDQAGWLEDMQNWTSNTWCDGSINLTLEVL